MRKSHRLAAALILAPVLSLAPAPVEAQFCLNNSIYLDLSDEAASFPICHDGVLTCQEPELQVLDVALDPPNCDQTFQSCAVTATVETKFPGNHQNDPSQVGFGYSFATLLLETESGGFVDACGFPGAAIQRDVGRFIHSVGVPCPLAKEDPEAFKLKLTATMCPCPPGVPFCPWQASCEKEVEATLDFVLPSLECPPKFECCEECGECLGAGSGGAAANGAAAGICRAGTGPGARLRYVAGGAGSENLPGSPSWVARLGRGWSHDYAERLVRDPDDSRVWLLTRFGSFREFRDEDADGLYEYVSPSDEKRPLRKVGGGWELEELDGTINAFDSSGRWQSTLDPDGVGKTATYGAGGLSEVTMPGGRRERFTYHPDGKLATIVEVGVDGTSTLTWGYAWSGDDLVEILRPDGTRWRYRYEDPRHPGYMTQSILVATDGSERIDTAWQYDHAGRAVRIWRGDVAPGPSGPVPGPDAVEVTSMSFIAKDPLGLVTEARVTDPLDQVSTYEFGRDSVSAKPRLKRISGDCPTCGLGPNSQLFYDDPANPMRPTRVVDGRGTTMLMTYDANGKITSRTEALATAVERTTTWEYDPDRPGQVVERERPSTSGSGVRRDIWTPDAAGNLVTHTREGVENGSAFSYTTVTTYNATGQPETVNPPGQGTADLRIFAYDPARGNLLMTSITEPLVGTTSFGYDAHNRRNRVIDPNGVTTETTYDHLDRVTAVILKGASAAEDLATANVYNPFGDLLRTTLPKGNVIEYGYDSVGRLISVERKPDAATRGERLFFTLDSAGNQIREESQRWDGGGWITESSTTFEYSNRCRLDQVVHPDGSATEYGYDCEGNLDRVWDANHPSAAGTAAPTQNYGYDELDRLVSITQPWAGAGGGQSVVAYGYDAQDNLNRVTDPNGTVTEYVYSDRGLQTRRVSEVSGATELTYDEHGKLTMTRDARGITVIRQRDAFDRVTAIDHPDDALDVTQVWDDPAIPFSRGRLTAVTRNGATIDYRYDRFGRLIRDGALTFGYDRNGNKASVGYPGGVFATYAYDFADRQATLSLSGAGGASGSLVSAAGYLPSGPLASLTLGNGLVESRDYDSRYFPARIRVPGHIDWQYATDAVGNVTAITDLIDPASSRTYEYLDVHYYLSRGDGPWGSRSWSYDRAGNRLTETRDGATESYGYFSNAAGGRLPTLQQVAPATGPATRQLYDPAGNRTFQMWDDKKTRFSYDSEQRLARLRTDSASGDQGLSSFVYDGRSFLREARSSTLLGTQAEVVTTATYSSEGVLYHRATIERTGPADPREASERASDAYVMYFAGRPVGILDLLRETPVGGTTSSSQNLMFLTTDHLGTPILATSGAAGRLWLGGFEPFGADYSGASEAGIFLRLPGQWVDPAWERDGLASGLHYNVHRWFDRQTGRYGRLDPVLIAGPLGVNLPYAYAANNPTFFLDLLGLEVTFEEQWLEDRYNELKECFPFFAVLMDTYESDSTTWRIRTDPPGDKCSESDLNSSPNTIWVLREGEDRGDEETNCRNTMKCLVHELYERWLIDWGGFEKSGMGAGPADKQARRGVGWIPLEDCCCKEPGEE